MQNALSDVSKSQRCMLVLLEISSHITALAGPEDAADITRSVATASDQASRYQHDYIRAIADWRIGHKSHPIINFAKHKDIIARSGL
jgi:hypothetical protein